MDPRRILTTAAFMMTACGCAPSQDGSATSRPAEFGFQQAVTTTLQQEGKAAYARHCVGCHGEQGDGNGPAAGFFDPLPRNFQKAKFKFSSTRSGQLPRDADLRRTIKAGLKGSAMPPFDLLPDRTVDALIAYIKTFSPRWRDRSSAKSIPVVEDPYRPEPDKSEAIARGEAIYHGFATCWTCHPTYVSEVRINEHRATVGSPLIEVFRDNLRESAVKPNSEGVIMYPPDFRRDFVRSGAGVEHLYRSIAAGITGTAMPTWVDSMHIPARSEGAPPLIEPADLWALAYYVQSVIAERPAKLKEDQVVLRERPKKIYLDGAPPPVPPQPEEAEDVELEEGDFEDEFSEEDLEDAFED